MACPLTREGRPFGVAPWTRNRGSCCVVWEVPGTPVCRDDSRPTPSFLSCNLEVRDSFLFSRPPARSPTRRCNRETSFVHMKSPDGVGGFCAGVRTWVPDRRPGVSDQNDDQEDPVETGTREK